MKNLILTVAFSLCAINAHCSVVDSGATYIMEREISNFSGYDIGETLNLVNEKCNFSAACVFPTVDILLSSLHIQYVTVDAYLKSRSFTVEGIKCNSSRSCETDYLNIGANNLRVHLVTSCKDGNSLHCAFTSLRAYK